jgi:hypothetical protein
VIVKRSPASTRRSSSGNFVFASKAPIFVFMMFRPVCHLVYMLPRFTKQARVARRQLLREFAIQRM